VGRLARSGGRPTTAIRTGPGGSSPSGGASGSKSPRLAGRAVSDEVCEVHHLRGDPVADREVTPGEQLAEVQLTAAVPGAGVVALELLHERELVERVPVLDDLAVLQPEEVDLVDRIAVACWLDAHERARVAGARGEPDGHAIVLGDHVVDLESRVREAGGASQLLDHAAQGRVPNGNNLRSVRAYKIAY